MASIMRTWHGGGEIQRAKVAHLEEEEEEAAAAAGVEEHGSLDMIDVKYVW
jgi:hypothetical protein